MLNQSWNFRDKKLYNTGIYRIIRNIIKKTGNQRRGRIEAAVS
jgi:hypothetical protein